MTYSAYCSSMYITTWNIEVPWLCKYVCIYVIQICSGVTSGRVLDNFMKQSVGKCKEINF